MNERIINSLSDIDSMESIGLLSYSGKHRVQLVMQSEVAECGLACIAMISSFHGYKINLPALRKQVALDASGMNLSQLMEVASSLNLSCRALKCPVNEINQLKLPCVLHWDMEHFVVLTGVNKKAIYVNDPAFGERKLSIHEFCKSYTGIALEITPTSSFQKRDDRIVMKITQLWDKIIGLRRSLISLFLLSVVLQAVALISPYYMQWVIDNVLLSNDKPLLVVLASGFVFLTIVKVGVEAFRSWLVLRLSSVLNIQMGANLFHHLLRLPIDYFEKRHVGDIVSRFGALSSIKEMLTTGLVEAVIDGVMASVVLVMMFLYNPFLTALVISVVLISLVVQLLLYYPHRRITEEAIIAEAKEESIFLESIRAIQTIKLFTQETKRQNSWLNRYADVVNTDIRLGRITIAEDAINSVLFGIESILVIYFGALIVIEGELTVGMLLAFVAYKTQFTSSIMNFIENIFSLKLVNLHLERLSDITLQGKEDYKHSPTVLPSKVSGHLRLEDICFRYADNTGWVLKNVSFEVRSGESLAIIGASGCGKTTLMKIILGLVKPCSGKVYLDDIDISDLPLTYYRRLIGAVMQNDTLLSGTLAENITIFSHNYDEKLLESCCRKACIWDDIQKMPMRLHSLVGDMGSNLSGGQLQRIFLARALYKTPVILCLDESTSHLDYQNELWINESISSLEMTRIIIAHRKETIESADRVFDLTGLKEHHKI